MRALISALWLSLAGFAVVTIAAPTPVEAQKKGKQGRKGKKKQKKALEQEDASEEASDDAGGSDDSTAEAVEAGDGTGEVDGKGKGKQKQREKEGRKHLARMAKIERLIALTQAPEQAELAKKAAMLKEKELRRHEKVLTRLDEGPGKGKGKDEAKAKGKKKRKGKGRKGKGGQR